MIYYNFRGVLETPELMYVRLDVKRDLIAMQYYDDAMKIYGLQELMKALKAFCTISPGLASLTLHYSIQHVDLAALYWLKDELTKCGAIEVSPLDLEYVC